MRKVIKFCPTIVVTFLLGVFAVWAFAFSYKAEMLLAQYYPHLVFERKGRGCGCGFSQSYRLLDGRSLIESNSAAVCNDNARMDVEKMLSKATKIIHRGRAIDESRERIAFLYFDNDSQIEKALILWHDESGYYQIDAPDMDTALTFETVKERF